MIGWRGRPSTPDEADKPKGFDDFDLRLGDLMRGERATLGKSLLDVQRELKIKATYIAAIENADISAFETPGFVAGYVRSYARYLGMNPDEAFARFCREANFQPAHGMSAAASSPAIAAARVRPSVEVRDPFADPNATFIPRGESLFARIEPGAVGSVLVLVALIGALGYGGWSVLQEVQRVQLAPVEQAPAVVADIDPIGNVQGSAPLVRSAPEATDTAALDPALDPARPDALDRLYRPQALDVPVMTSRDGPIAAINPRDGTAAAPNAIESAVAEAAAQDPATGEVQVVADAKAPVELLAVRPSWVRVQAADGTVLFEKILDAGERYAVPQLEEPAKLRAGNSGSVYFAVNGQTYGPAAPGAQVVKNVELSPQALTEKFAVADLSGDVDLAKFLAVADASAVNPSADPAAAPSE
ncbi:helix-turn-helix domain-containing protein [Neotabrizicola shimadae]|uniref:Helix-turn-helix domain-containing protein n=1 Tax=Neotabrizicola shimadae TaxID=2807096 RepID=A0A8G0ZZR9_9RHOB|nr:helix-turn-helix domain-containing protein [Neotabrizicola shimadae]QYZ71409.1 helix-turn-helix domain-containing protein [Neotabrizicola shimadae]